MKLYVCGKCFTIVACEEEEFKLCQNCPRFQLSHLPCEEYLKATEVSLDNICWECQIKIKTQSN